MQTLKPVLKSMASQIGVVLCRESLRDHLINHVFVYITVGIYLLDTSRKTINFVLYLVARLYTVNKYKIYCTTNQVKEALWGNVLLLVFCHVSFTETLRFILDSSQFALGSICASYASHLGLAALALELDIKSRLIKDLNVMSKFRKSLKFMGRFGRDGPSRVGLSNWQGVLFFVYIYNNTSNCILWYTEAVTRNRWHVRDLARFTLFKAVLLLILWGFIRLRAAFEDASGVEYVFVAVSTYLFSLIENEFMKENLILEKKLPLTQSIDFRLRQLRVRQRVRTGIDRLWGVLFRSKSSVFPRTSKPEESDKRFNKSVTVHGKAKKD